MATDDKEIINLIGRDPNGGFRQLMGKYQEAVYWHVRRMVVSHDDEIPALPRASRQTMTHRMPRRKPS